MSNAELIERLEKLSTARFVQLDRLRCDSGMCFIVKPRVMATNGPCRCRRDEILMEKVCRVNQVYAESIDALLRALDHQGEGGAQDG